MIVVDASVLTDFLLGRAQALDAVRDVMVGRDQQPLHAPELIDPETLNALRQLVRRGAVTERRASQAVDDLADVRLVRFPHAPLRARVWELRDELTAYDATYLALAEALDAATLLTADRALATRARRSLGADGVRHAG